MRGTSSRTIQIIPHESPQKLFEFFTKFDYPLIHTFLNFIYIFISEIY